MRIGILTVPFNNNYGGYLQCYALQEVLKSLGHEPMIIMRRHAKRSVGVKLKCVFFIKNLLLAIKIRRRLPLLYDKERLLAFRGKKMRSFVINYLNAQTDYYYSDEELRKYCNNKFDAICVGSDQVWRPIYVPKIENYFLDFTEGWDIKRIVYAASFGTDTPEYTIEQKTICGQLISKFDAVSVREESAKNIIKQFEWNIDITVVADPTLLLKKEDYEKILGNTISEAKEKIFCYVLDHSSESQSLINKLCVDLRKELIDLSNIQKGMSILPSIETWLSYIRDCDLVVTDSFHGTIFSLIMNKPFFVCPNGQRGEARLFNLLKTYGLEQQILNIPKDEGTISLPSIDWNRVNSIIEVQRGISLSYIRNSFR